MSFNVPQAKFGLTPLRVCAVGATFLLCLLVQGRGQVLYWDANGTATGAGTTPSGTWSTTGTTNQNWSTNSAGTSATVNWTSGRDAVFSAGTNATGNYTVAVSGMQNVSSLTLQEGNLTFSGGVINFSDASPSLVINSGRTLNWGTTGFTSSTNILNVSGGGILNLSQSGTYAGTINFSGGTLRLTNADLTLGTLNITGNTILDFAGAASSLSLTNFAISAGVTLTIQNWQNAVDLFSTTNWSGALKNTMGSAPMNQITFAGFPSSVTGWDAYDNQIRPNVPEPSTYGLVFLSVLLGTTWIRKMLLINN